MQHIALKFLAGLIATSTIIMTSSAAPHKGNAQYHKRLHSQAHGTVFEIERGNRKIKTNNYYKISQRELKDRIVKTSPLLSKGL